MLKPKKNVKTSEPIFTFPETVATHWGNYYSMFLYKQFSQYKRNVTKVFCNLNWSKIKLGSPSPCNMLSQMGRVFIRNT